jgi:hypothetical protein
MLKPGRSQLLWTKGRGLIWKCSQRNRMKRLAATSRGDIMLHTFCGSRPHEGVKTSHGLHRQAARRDRKGLRGGAAAMQRARLWGRWWPPRSPRRSTGVALPRAKHVRSYLGLVPREYISGERWHRGRISKAGGRGNRLGPKRAVNGVAAPASNPDLRRALR